MNYVPAKLIVDMSSSLGVDIFTKMHFLAFDIDNGLEALQLNISTDRSKAVLPFGSFVLFLSCVSYAFMHVCLLMPCGLLLGKC